MSMYQDNTMLVMVKSWSLSQCLITEDCFHALGCVGASLDGDVKSTNNKGKGLWYILAKRHILIISSYRIRDRSKLEICPSVNNVRLWDCGWFLFWYLNFSGCSIFILTNVHCFYNWKLVGIHLQNENEELWGQNEQGSVAVSPHQAEGVQEIKISEVNWKSENTPYLRWKIKILTFCVFFLFHIYRRITLK